MSITREDAKAIWMDILIRGTVLTNGAVSMPLKIIKDILNTNTQECQECIATDCLDGFADMCKNYSPPEPKQPEPTICAKCICHIPPATPISQRR